MFFFYPDLRRDLRPGHSLSEPVGPEGHPPRGLPEGPGHLDVLLHGEE